MATTVGHVAHSDSPPASRTAAVALANASVALPMQLPLTLYYRDIAGLRCRQIAEIIACRAGIISSRLHGGRQCL
jgi:RNA polymerase sigma-70 factor (ECF subfamily)